MKTSRHFVTSFLLLLFICLPAMAQSAGGGSKRFANGGTSFEYPAAWTISDKSTADNQHLVLELKGTSAQIMILVEREASTQPGQRATMVRARTTTFADLMTQEFEKVGATVQRSEVSTEAGGVQAEGLRLRASPGGQPGNVEVYSFVLGGRIVMITYLRPDTDATAAAPAWGLIRRSLRVTASTASTGATITTPPPPPARPARFAGLDYGKVTGSAYANSFFGFRLTIPYGWRVQGQDVKDMLGAKGREAVAGDDPRRTAQIDNSIANTVNLLTVFKYAVGSDHQEFNASLICGAEWLANPSMTSGQYMASAKRILQTSKDQYSFQPITTETIGGESFTVMEVETSSAVKQKYYAAIKKGYALFFIVTYATEEDEAVLRQALRSVRFV